jgi:hypothetical protein
MSNILTLLRLEFREKYGYLALSNKNAWIKIIIGLAAYAGLLYVIYSIAAVLFKMFDKAGMGYEALVLLFTILFFYLLTTGVSSTIKVLYYKGDNIILMRFPVSGSDIFISKTLFLLLSQIVNTGTVVVPFILAYARVSGAGGFYYSMTPIVLLFLVLIPFFLSNVLAIPIMHLTNKIRNKFGLIIVLLSALLALMFAVYMFLFERVVDYMRDQSYSVFSDEIVVIIQKATYYLVPTKYFANILVHKSLYVALPWMIMLTGGSLAGMIAVIGGLYQKTLLKNIEIEGAAFIRKTKNRKKPIFLTLLNKEFIQVFRSLNYSFQYFVLACSMPVMVYFCNSISQKIGATTIGDQINVGLTILVMLIFATVITSLSATSVSREGNNFYHTKTMPVPVRTQLFVKFTMYLIVSFAANAVCVLILIFTKMMSPGIAWWVFGLVESLSIAMTLRSMRFDVRKPRFNLSGEGEIVANNANTTSSIVMGFAVAVIEGMLAMAVAYLFGPVFMEILCTVFAVIVIVYAVAAYTIRLKRTYEKIVK